MKQCDYCGHGNQDAAVACCECGKEFEVLPASDAQSLVLDPALAPVIVATFGSLQEASLLAIRLEAAGIEAFIPEEYANQLFSNVIPLGGVTVRVAAKSYEAAKAIAADQAETGPPAAVEGAWNGEGDTAGESTRSRLAALARHAIWAAGALLVVMPILFGALTHLFREREAAAALFWLWALFTVSGFFWGHYISHRYRSLALSCEFILALQVISFLLLFVMIDSPAKTGIGADAPSPTLNRHDW
jgi:hypothetical protein